MGKTSTPDPVADAEPTGLTPLAVLDALDEVLDAAGFDPTAGDKLPEPDSAAGDKSPRRGRARAKRASEPTPDEVAVDEMPPVHVVRGEAMVIVLWSGTGNG